VSALRDVDEPTLEELEDAMAPADFERALHVVREMERPIRLHEAFAANDLATAGRLMNESHASLRDLYEVSSAELDLMCDVARVQPGCHGARMTGAGFGGCAIALVDTNSAEDFSQRVGEEYRRATGRASSVFATRAAAGARLLDS
jgi:galactokinase